MWCHVEPMNTLIEKQSTHGRALEHLESSGTEVL